MDKNYEFVLNEDIEVIARWSDEDGVPYPLSAAVMQVRSAYGFAASNPPVFDLSIGSGITIDGEGWVVARVPEAQVDDTMAGEYKYDLVVTRTTDGVKKNLLRGALTLKAPVSDA